MDYLKSLKEINNIQNALKFLTGGIQIPVISQIKVSSENFIEKIFFQFFSKNATKIFTQD